MGGELIQLMDIHIVKRRLQVRLAEHPTANSMIVFSVAVPTSIYCNSRFRLLRRPSGGEEYTVATGCLPACGAGRRNAENAIVRTSGRG